MEIRADTTLTRMEEIRTREEAQLVKKQKENGQIIQESMEHNAHIAQLADGVLTARLNEKNFALQGKAEDSQAVENVVIMILNEAELIKASLKDETEIAQMDQIIEQTNTYFSSFQEYARLYVKRDEAVATMDGIAKQAISLVSNVYKGLTVKVKVAQTIERLRSGEKDRPGQRHQGSQIFPPEYGNRLATKS